MPTNGPIPHHDFDAFSPYQLLTENKTLSELQPTFKTDLANRFSPLAVCSDMG